jgi:regulator of protease activity HflC (stomatin/prohibitin superfamily)
MFIARGMRHMQIFISASSANWKPMDTVTLGGIIALGTTLVVTWLCTRTFIVKTNNVIVIERYGIYHRILHPGMHFLWHLFDAPVETCWTYIKEGNPGGRLRTCIKKSIHVPTENVKLDSLPVDSYTSDHVRIKVDGTLHYRINDVHRAVYMTSDLLGHLNEIVGVATRAIMAERLHTEVIGQEPQIAREIMDRITEIAAKYGIACTDFIVQEVVMDTRITDAIEQSIASERANSVAIAEMQHRHAREMVQYETEQAAKTRYAQNQAHAMQLELENAAARRAMEHKNALLEIEFQLREQDERSAIIRSQARIEMEMASERARREAEADVYRLQTLKDAGVNMDDIITLSAIPHMTGAASRADKWFVLPSDNVRDMAMLPAGAIRNMLPRRPRPQTEEQSIQS